jgi:hypothetical protein
MLRSNRDGVCIRMNGKQGWVSGTRSRQHLALSLPLVAFLGILCWKGAVATAVSDWGMCNMCQWWQLDREARMADIALGTGIEEAPQPFRLRVSGKSGCQCDIPGERTHAAGSSTASPTAEPQR